MGVSLAKACRNMGADVTLVLANSPLEVNGVKIIRVDTVAQMREEVIRSLRIPTTHLLQRRYPTINQRLIASQK